MGYPELLLAQARQLADGGWEVRAGMPRVAGRGEMTYPGLYNVNLELPAEQRSTFRTGSQQLDYLFVSQALRGHLAGVHIERRGIYTKTKWPHYPEVTSTRTQASDHGAVVADFSL